MTPDVPAVRLRDVSVTRGSRLVLGGLDVQLTRGRVIGLLGPSGSGKTTLLRALVGVQANVKGTVEVLGRPAGHPALRHEVAYVTQSASVYGDLTVTENLDYFAALAGLGRREAPSRVAGALATVGLADRGGDVVARLSGGQRSRVSLAAALLGRPAMLVLDEPTVGLDPVLRNELWATFAALAHDGVTLVVSSHVMDEAARCDELVLLRQGRILAHDTVQGLLAVTATTDIDGAFLALIERATQGPPGGRS